MQRLTTRQGWWTYVPVLQARDEFTTSGALRGARSYGHASIGRLPADYRQSIDGATYVIYSYATPIAWLDANGVWQVPDVKYSVTTSRHQSLIATAVSELPAAERVAYDYRPPREQRV